MILVDSSVWIDHFNMHHEVLESVMRSNSVVIHPLVLGELAIGQFKQRARTLKNLALLPSVPEVSHDLVRYFIDHEKLYGQGIGYVDCHLLASSMTQPGCSLWTHDRRLKLIAKRLTIAFDPAH